jgi:uncharacterized membrane protein
MAFCTKCGKQVADGTAFCPSCGQSMAAPAAPAASTVPATAPAGGTVNTSAPTEGLSENVAGLLCYLGVWLTGLIFLLIDKRPFVKYHAAQSIVVFGGLTVIYFVLGQFFVTSWFMGGWGLVALLFLAVRLIWLILWILLMVTAYQGQRFRVPIAADFADKLAGK